MRKRRILRLITAIMCLALLVAMPPTRASRAENALAVGYVNTGALNLRKGAGTDNAIVDTLTKNTIVNIREVSGTWLRVDVPATGKSGYVSGTYITVDGASLAAYALGVTSGKVNLRREATSSSESLAVVPDAAGLTIYSVDAKTGWYMVKVHATGKEGYLSPRYVKIVTKADQSRPAGEIAASGVNLRTGPSTSYKSLGTLKKGTALTVLEKSGSWYKVTIKATNQTGYVFADYVKIVSVSGIRGSINGSGVNLRTGPGTSYTRQGTLKKNTVVIILGKSGSWYQVIVDATGARGYVYATYVTVSAGAATPTPQPAPLPAASLAGKVNASGVNLRTGPSTRYTSLGLLSKGTAVTVLSTSGDWYRLIVNATSQTGYIFAGYVTITAVIPTFTPTPAPTAAPTPTMMPSP